MGAWGVGNFENDSAMDWVWDLKKSKRLKLLESTVSNVLDSKEYIVADLGSIGLAAAEVVAALNGKPLDRLPEDVSDWVKSQRRRPDLKLTERAREAVQRIKTEEISELKQLWEEGDEPPTDWYAAVDDLIKRLHQKFD